MKKYEVVENYIKDKINMGFYPAGSRIPSEEELMEKLQMSRNPVRRALDELVGEGIIYKIQGSGSFVKNGSIPEAIDIYAILPSESINIETYIIQGMRAALEDSMYKNIHLILKKPGKDTLEQIEILNMIPHYHKGGVIFLPIGSPDRPLNRLLAANIRKLNKEGYPAIQVDNYIPEYSGSYVITNNRTASFSMMNLLHEQGHTVIAIIYRHIFKQSIKLRISGVKNWFRENEIPLSNLILYNMDESIIDGDFVNSLIDRGITAVFGLECELIRDLFLALEKANLRVPEDLSLCSFDEHCFRDIKSGFLTSIIQKCDSIGYYAVQLLLDMIEGKTDGGMEMLIESSIVKRKSVAKI